MAQGTLEIVFPRRSEKCSVFFGENLIDKLPLEAFSGLSYLVIVSDDVVSKLYAQKLRDRLSQATKTCLIVMQHGERSKNLLTVSKIVKKMSDLGLDRKSAVLALGGGVVGDTSGFVASIFKRGIKYFQFPTTLLAQVDSSIGGKCGIDTEWGKNQIGTFCQPAGIFITASVLDTLPKSEIVNGLGEIVKTSIISDRTMFNEIESSPEDYFTIRKLKTLIRRTCEIKLSVVEKDELETNFRRILNYGHTIGHAIEASSDYKLSHGKSVILGMICEGWIANKLRIFDDGDYDRQLKLLSNIKDHYGIKILLNRRKILSFAMLDKKITGATIRMSLPKEIGKMYSSKDGEFAVPVSKEMLVRSLDCLK